MTRCQAHVTPKDGERRPCAFHAVPGGVWCEKHRQAAAKVNSIRQFRLLANAFNQNAERAQRYAEAMSRRDREGRHEGRPEHDFSTDNRRI